ncbi:MAG: hypothetical protein K6B52_08285 [Clostridiales bacterium]|nr:hypothetical protein [Clostridiales bacterium]
MKEKMNKKYNLNHIFYNNKALFVFSFVVAVLLWIFVSVELSPETENVIKNVPVSIDYSKIEETLGLVPFGESNFTVNVTIRGKKYIVTGSDIFDDLSVTANIGYVNTAGDYSLQLECTSVKSRPNYTIESLSVNEVTVYFDYKKDEEFVLEPDIEYTLGDGYCADTLIFTDSQKIKVTGPEREINKIEKVVATASIKDEIIQTTTVDAAIKTVTKDGSTPKYLEYNRKNGSTTVKIPVYEMKTLNMSVSLKNSPTSYIDTVPFIIKINPQSARVGVPTGKGSEIGTFEIAAVDYSSLRPGINKKTVKSKDITSGIILDDIEEFNVEIDVAGFDEIKIPAPENIEVLNLPQGSMASISPKSFDFVEIVGPSESASIVNPESLRFYVEISDDKEVSSGVYNLPLELDSPDSWIYGTYTVTVSVK